MNIVLIGARGTGKSTTANRLAILSKRLVLTTDLLISYDNGGQSITQLVKDPEGGGWHTFRELEYQVVNKVARLDNLIIDTGGGVVVDLTPDGDEVYSRRKIDALKHKGFLVWLKGDLRRAAARSRNDAGRPPLHPSLLEEEVMRRRLPFYEKAADLVIHVENKQRHELALELFDKLPPHIRD